MHLLPLKSPQTQAKKRVLQIEPKRAFNLTMKLALSNFGFKDRYTAEQVAYTLEEVLEAVENGRKEVLRDKKIENPFQ